MTQTENGPECVNNYEEVFQTCELRAISIAKVKIIQALIPTNWNNKNFKTPLKILSMFNIIMSLDLQQLTNFN
jgi:hypothetical protein